MKEISDSSLRILNELDEIIYLCDPDTYEIEFMNAYSRKIFHISEKEYHSKKCYEVFAGRTSPCTLCAHMHSEDDPFSVWKYDNQYLGCHFLMQDQIVSFKGKSYRLMITLSLSKSNTLNAAVNTPTNSKNEIISYIDHVNKQKDIDSTSTIKQLLKVLERYYKADFSFTGEIDKKSGDISQSFLWGKEELRENHIHHIFSLKTYQKIILCQKQVFVVSDINSMSDLLPSEIASLRRWHVQSLIFAFFILDNQNYGFICVINPKDLHEGSHLFSNFSYLSKIILNKLNMTDDLFKANAILSVCPSSYFQFKAKMPFRLIYANDQFFTLRNCTREQAKSEYHNEISQFIEPNDLKKVESIIMGLDLVKHPCATFSLRIITRDEKILWLFCSCGISLSKGEHIISCIEYDITKQKLAENQLKISEEQLRIALNQIDATIWDYDLASKSIMLIDLSISEQAHPKRIENVPEQQIKNGHIHPDSIKTVRQLYRNVHSGKKTATATYRALGENGIYQWKRVTYTNIFDDSGKPVHAIAISENVSDQMDTLQQYHREEIYRGMINRNRFVSYRINLTQNQVTSYQVEDTMINELSHAKTYDKLIADSASRALTSDGHQQILQTFSKESLQKLFDTGATAVSCEYQRVNSDGKIIWAKTTINLAKNEHSNDLLGFFYVENIDENKKAELALRERAEHDVMTGFYLKDTAIALIEESLGQNHHNRLCALMMIDLDNFKNINDTLGHLYGDKVLTEISRPIRSNFESQTILGRFGGDEFIIFFREVDSAQTVCKKAELFCRLLNKAPEGKSKKNRLYISCSIGIAISMSQEVNFETLFEHADTAMYHAKRNGKNGYHLYTPEDSMKKGLTPYYGRENPLHKAIFEDMGLPAIIINPESYKILFLNTKAKSLFNTQSINFAHCTCYEFFHGRKEPCTPCLLKEKKENHTIITKCLIGKIQRQFYVHFKSITWNGKIAYLCLMSARKNDFQILSDFNPGQNTIFKIAKEFQEIEPLSKAIRTALKDLASYYDAIHACYLEISEENFQVSNFIEWFCDDQPSYSNVFSVQQTTAFVKWLSGLEKSVPYCMNNLTELYAQSPECYASFHQLGIHFIYILPFRLNQSKIISYLCILNPSAHLLNFNLIQSLVSFFNYRLFCNRIQKNQDYAMYHDSVTGLSNWDDYYRYLLSIDQETLSSVGIVCIVIKDLKQYYIQCGISLGNRLVKKVSEKISEYFKDSKVFRLSKDEFLVLYEDISNDHFTKISSCAEDIFQKNFSCFVNMAYIWESYNIHIENLVSTAEDRIISKKSQPYHLDEMEEKATFHSSLAYQWLQKALEKKMFHVFLQPQATLSDGKICGAEALIRYIHPKFGIIPPNKFIPLLEKSHLVHYIDFYVFRTVCETLKQWKEKGHRLIGISLNFSRTTLLQMDLIPTLKNICKEYEVNPKQIMIEITESFGSVNSSTITEISKNLQKEGFRIALDDFGAKYSGIAMLSTVKLDQLKFDRGFINTLSNNPAAQSLTKFIISFCESLKIGSVAEGVEHLEQARILRSLGCQKIQGYLLNKPIPIGLFEQKYS